MFTTRVKMNDRIKNKVFKRLRATTNDELMRWIDNIHTAIGMNVMEMRKNLTPDRQDQVLVNIEDMREGAVSLLAALQVVEERLTKP